jgi:hypothetical protein
VGSRFLPYLAAWFHDGLASGRFRVPNSRDVVLNEFPRLLRESRLLASAAVEADELRAFIIAINPTIVCLADVSPSGLRQQLVLEQDLLPGLRRATLQVTPDYHCERWFVYTPPLAMMREGWKLIKPRLVDAA